MVFLSFALALAASAQAFEFIRVEPAPQAFSGPASTQLPAAQFTVPITGKGARASFKKAMLNELASSAHKPPKKVFNATLFGSDDDEEYLTDIKIGGQNFKVIIDTGSSDTWLAQKGFKCFNLTSFPEPTETCGFASTFDPKKSKTYEKVPNKNFNISYGDGEFLTGGVALETVTVGGLTVKKQEIGLVTNAAWNGDSINSGLMGLAFPELTSVYNGTDVSKDNRNNSDHYNPFFFTAVDQKAVAQPFFSVALDRGSPAAQQNSTIDPNLGWLAFGGIAPVKVTNTAASVPIQGFKSSSGVFGYFFYTVEIDAYKYAGASANLTGAGKQAILDTGTTLNYLPTDVAADFNSKFTPPAVNQDGFWIVDCNATAPVFTATIGGVDFTVDPKDNILPSGTDENGKPVCISGTQDGGDPTDPRTIYILGDVFLHNVVSTFNIKSDSITLTQRAPY